MPPVCVLVLRDDVRFSEMTCVSSNLLFSSEMAGPDRTRCGRAGRAETTTRIQNPGPSHRRVLNEKMRGAQKPGRATRKVSTH